MQAVGAAEGHHDLIVVRVVRHKAKGGGLREARQPTARGRQPGERRKGTHKKRAHAGWHEKQPRGRRKAREAEEKLKTKERRRA